MKIGFPNDVLVTVPKGVAGKLKLIKGATSFGGVHTTIEHRASIETGTTTPKNLLRISVGLEDAEDLLWDLAQALSPAAA